jgi:HPt (histidine-containing phosphotransfer) domain-containing protein
LNEEALIHLRKNFDETTTRMLFETAMISIDETLQNIQQRDMEEEMELLVEDFHRLKGILLNLGLEKLAKQADKLQLSAKNKELLESLDLKEHLIHTLTQLLL